MTRKEFFSRAGFGAAIVLLPACIAGMASSCSSDDSTTSSLGTSNTTPSASSDFTIDVSMGALATDGGFLVTQGIIVARTNGGDFLAVSAACPHEGTIVNYDKAGNKFVCPRHNSQFTSKGVVTVGPASSNLTEYRTSLSGTTLTVFV
jgi:cytochrome b6-f complex iron-sulfur subunit